MSYSLDFLPAVEDEIIDASLWYENKKEGLGLDFLLSVEATLHSIRRDPLHFQTVHKNTRRAMTKRFPYGIFFILEDQTITILATISFHCHPAKWQKRLPD